MLLLAGEVSGDVYGAGLAAALRRRHPEVSIAGIGGPMMRAAGVNLLAGLDRLAVMGFAEVLPRLPYFWWLERRLTRLVEAGDVRLVVLVDYPGFNLRIARVAHRRGVPVLYYVAPQVWAWRSERTKTIARVADRVAAILPFEVDFLTAHGANATFVGHPLLDAEVDPVPDRTTYCARWGLDERRPILALLPGSRHQELRRHLGLFAEAARRVVAERPDVAPVIARAPGLPAGACEGEGLPVVDDARALLSHARAALVKSGTGTLEAALLRTPMVVAYRTSGLTWAMARRLVRVPHVALPNLIAGARVVPELLQEDATPAGLAREVMTLLDDGESRVAQLRAFESVRASLGSAGVAERVADLAVELLGASR